MMPFVHALASLLCMSPVIGIAVVFTIFLAGTFASPLYASLYAIEGCTRGRYFKFRLPRTPWLRHATNIIACLATYMVVTYMIIAAKKIHAAPADWLNILTDAQAIITVICFAALFIISHFFAKPDDRTWYQKLEDLGTFKFLSKQFKMD